MNLFKTATIIFCVTLIGVAVAPGVKADEWNKKTVVTFNVPVEIPGVHLAGWSVLPAGTYVFKLLDSKSDRHVVQIFNKDEPIVYATVLTVPDHRLKATEKTVITFDERPTDQPEALRAWFYPGSNSGEEFVYPKSRAIELAKSNKVPVPFTAVDVSVEAAEPIKSVTAPVVVAMEQAQVSVAQPNGEEAQNAPVAAASPVLPSTASNAPLFGLLGFLAP